VVTWASSNTAVATVNASGLVTGVTAGTVTISATSEGKSGTATVTVTATVTNPGTVSNLSVASVTANSVTLSFTEVINGAGAPASYDVRYAVAPLSWGAATPVAQGTCAVPLAGTTIGATRTCTVQGLAASTSYQFQLVAFRGTLNVDAVFGALSNVASGTTAASTAPVAPLPGSWPNEPSGFTVVRDTPWNTVNGGSWSGATSLTTVVADATAPHSPSNVLQFRYPAGFVGGDAPGTIYSPGVTGKEYFVGMWWKPSNPWQSHPSVINKVFFFYTDAWADVVMTMYGSGSYYLKVVTQGMPSSGPYLEQNVNTVPVVLGQWHRIEMHVKYDSYYGARDGFIRWWVNGTLVGDHRGLGFPNDAGFAEFQLSPTWGGVGGTKSRDDFYWYDHVYLSRR
jgi:hypothetical protein